MTARENVSQTHTSSENVMRNSMSSRPNDKIGQKTLSKFKRCSYIAIASKTDTCFAHPNWNSNTQRSDLETYVDNASQRDRRKETTYVLLTKHPEPNWETGKLVNPTKTPKSNTHLHHLPRCAKNVWPKIEKYQQRLTFWTTTLGQLGRCHLEETP